MKRFKIIIAVGLLNLIHGGIHILQFIQSVLLTYYSFGSENEHNWVHELMENPFMGLLWGALGALTIYIGYKDYLHHKFHKD